MRSANPRSRARSWVLQVMYGWDMAGDGSVREWAREALRGRAVSPRYRPYIDQLLLVLDEQGAEHFFGEPALELDDIQRVEHILPGVFELGFAFNQWTLGEETMQRLGFSPEQYNEPSFSMASIVS